MPDSPMLSYLSPISTMPTAIGADKGPTDDEDEPSGVAARGGRVPAGVGGCTCAVLVELPERGQNRARIPVRLEACSQGNSGSSRRRVEARRLRSGDVA